MSYHRVSVHGKSNSKPLADAEEVFRARCQARVSLIAAGIFDFHEAVDGLWAAAVRANLVSKLGADRIQEIMAGAFAPIHSEFEKPNYSADIANICDCDVAPAADCVQPYRLVSRDGVAPASELQRIYERTIAERDRNRLPTSTLDALNLVVRQKDPERFRRFMAARTPHQRKLIKAYLR